MVSQVVIDVDEIEHITDFDDILTQMKPAGFLQRLLHKTYTEAELKLVFITALSFKTSALEVEKRDLSKAIEEVKCNNNVLQSKVFEYMERTNKALRELNHVTINAEVQVDKAVGICNTLKADNDIATADIRKRHELEVNRLMLKIDHLTSIIEELEKKIH